MERKIKITLLALLALTLTGCEEDEAYRMTTDGHAYIVIKTDCGVGMVHDPDCPCKNNHVKLD